MIASRLPRSPAAALLSVAALAAMFLAGDRLLAWAAATAVANSPAPLAKAYAGGLDQEVWIAGNSRAIHSFDADLLAKATGKRVVNLGVNGLRPALAHAVLLDAIDKNGPPEVLILEVSYLKNPFDTSRAADFLLFADRGTHLARLLADRLPKQMCAARIFQLRRYGGELFFRSLAANRQGRHAAMARTITDEQIAAIEQKPIESFGIDETDLATLGEVLQRCHESGARVLLILAPYLAEYRSRIDNLERFATPLREAARQESGIRYLDGSKTLGEARFFADQVHVNRLGKENFTQWLVAEPAIIDAWTSGD